MNYKFYLYEAAKWSIFATPFIGVLLYAGMYLGQAK